MILTFLALEPLLDFPQNMPKGCCYEASVITYQTLYFVVKFEKLSKLKYNKLLTILIS